MDKQSRDITNSSPAPEEAIRECPWCQRTKQRCRVWSALSEFYIECDGCFARSPVLATREAAIAAWNRRAGDEREYTREEMREACQNNYNAGLAEAAAACERLISTHRIKVGTYAVAANEDRKCADAIRNLTRAATSRG